MATSTPQALPRSLATNGGLTAMAQATTVPLWAVAYAWLSPAVNGPGWPLAILAALMFVTAGMLAGRTLGKGLISGLHLGLLIGLINFVIVASLHGRETTADALIGGATWIIGVTLVAIVLCGAGSIIGSAGVAPAREYNWSRTLCFILAVMTGLLLISGGIVTGLEAGLAVPDWLTTFNFPMMFYPMVEMLKKPDVYAEHFHRLWGLLVGLSTILLVIHMQRVESRTWLKRLAIVILLAVIVQGILGGSRVTEKHISLAIAHGVFAQIVFATVVAMTAFTSDLWRSERPPSPQSSATTDRTFTAILVGLLIAQLILGALYRHLRREWDAPPAPLHVLLTHMVVAALVTATAIFVGGRALSVNRGRPVLPALGKTLLALVGLQLLLGLSATIVVWSRPSSASIPKLEVVVTTAHQAVGALLLANAALLVLWTRRWLDGNSAGPSTR